MTRPRCSSRVSPSTGVERTPRRLGKLCACVGGSGAVWRSSGFEHLRFATPARGPLHHCRCDALGCSLGPSRDRARLTPEDTGQSRTITAHVPATRFGGRA